MKEENTKWATGSNLIDYRLTEIGKQNWEVCSRMLVHDLLDLSLENPELKKILDFYRISYTSNGGYTMALPRLMLNKKEVDMKKSKKKK